MKRKIAFLLVLSVVLFQACTVKKVKHVESIKIETGGIITIMQGNKDKFYGPKDMEATVTDGVLTISGGNGESVSTLILKEKTISNLTGISISDGFVNCDSLVIENDNLAINLSNNSSISGSLIVNNATMNLSGNAFVGIMGEGDNLTLNMSDDAQYTCVSMKWANATVNLTDNAKCTIYVINKLTATASGDANLGYIGVTDSVFTTSGDAKIFRFPGVTD